ncbi:MAG: microcompartment protein [Pseudomonadota bacterium]
MTQLRVYLQIDRLQPQFAAYMSTPTRARGYPPIEGDTSLFVEVAPALAIHRIADLALKAYPELEPGVLFTERQFGLLELHAQDADKIASAGQVILKGIGAKADSQLVPKTLFADIIDDLSDQHAIILNRTREASMILPGQALLLYEVEPALFAALAANEAEKVAPEATLVSVQMIGATGRIFLAGKSDDLARAKARIDEVLAELAGA